MGLNSNYLTVDAMNDIQNQFLDIQAALIEAGYESPSVETENVTFDYLPTEIKDLFNEQEQNTQNIDAVVDWVNPYSALYEWGKKNGAIFSHINRWWQWAEFNLDVINGNQQKQQYLTDINGEYITNINGDNILTYEGYF